MRNHTERLLEEIRQAAPNVISVRVRTHGDPTTVTVDPAGEQANAQDVIDAFVWSDAAHDAWLEDQKPERKTLRQQAIQAVQDNLDFLALANPNNATVLAHVRRLTQQNNHIIRRLVQID